MDDYEARAIAERERFDAELEVHDLPPSHDVWSDAFLTPKLAAVGLSPLLEGFADLIARTGEELGTHVAVVSLGAGNCDVEVDLARRLLGRGIDDFSVTCVELSSAMVERGRAAAADADLLDRVFFETADLNEWEPSQDVGVFLANHSLHHVVELEHLFDGVRSAMGPASRFLVNDVIGRNGHMRWPEALAILEPLWRRLPSRYKFNRQLRRQEDEFVNWDCSKEGFEGIRAQDVLPCLMSRFAFEVFVGYANLSDVFIDRGFGPNFDMDEPDDRELVLRMGRLDEELIDLGAVTPTKMVASLRTTSTGPPKVWKGWTPEFCVRDPHDVAAGELAALGRIGVLEAQLIESDVALDDLQSDLDAALAELEFARAELEYARAEVDRESGSLAGRVVRHYRDLVSWAAPPGSHRWRGYQWSHNQLLRIGGRPNSVESMRGSGSESHSEPIALSRASSPRASIVVPVHGKWPTTERCLRSVAMNTGSVPYEVIVVDDASPDDTASRLSGIPDLTSVGIKANVGFVRAANAGAAAATAEFIVFLNNDTEVRPGWLAALLQAIETDPSVGAVGAKVLWSDGRVQEAGSIVYDDGSALNYGHGDSGASFHVNWLREVDYCSGACLLVRRSLFDELGGFDQRYSPAYYEDTDLAFRIREKGYRVLYQPEAEVIHSRGTSYGEDGSRRKDLQMRRNRDVFTVRWREALLRTTAAWMTSLALATDDRRPLVLVIDHRLPTPDRDSGSVRMMALLQLLLERARVSFIPHNLAYDGRYARPLQQMGIEVVYDPPDLRSHLRAVGPEVALAWVARPFVAADYEPLIRKVMPTATLVYDTIDLHSLRFEREAALALTDSTKRLASLTMRKLETRVARGADAVIAISSEEASSVREIVGDKPVFTFPNVITDEVESAPFDARHGMMFLGSFEHPPNLDAIDHLVNDVMPLVWQRQPGIVLHVAGSSPTGAIRAMARDTVVVHGWLPDLGPLFRRCRLMAAPLRFGAGMKGKVGQSLARGLPVVTSSIGAEGMDLIDEQHALIVDDPEAVAAAIVRLHSDPALWARLSTNGAAWVRQTLGTDAARTRLDTILAELGFLTPSVSGGHPGDSFSSAPPHT